MVQYTVHPLTKLSHRTAQGASTSSEELNAQVSLPTDKASYLQIMMIGKETSERTLRGLWAPWWRRVHHLLTLDLFHTLFHFLSYHLSICYMALPLLASGLPQFCEICCPCGCTVWFRGSCWGEPGYRLSFSYLRHELSSWSPCPLLFVWFLFVLGFLFVSCFASLLSLFGFLL